jgi:hypothetical protein
MGTVLFGENAPKWLCIRLLGNKDTVASLVANSVKRDKMKAITPPGCLPVTAAEKEVGVAHGSMLQAMKRGKIPFQKVGIFYFVNVVDAEEWVKSVNKRRKRSEL